MSALTGTTTILISFYKNDGNNDSIFGIFSDLSNKSGRSEAMTIMKITLQCR